MIVNKIQDGINLREKKVKRGYLRQEEMNAIIMLASTHQLIKGLRGLHDHGDGVPTWDKFAKSGIITKEQSKYLKMSMTYLEKFLDSFILDNLDRKTKETVAKRIAKWELRVADDYMIQKLDNMLRNSRERTVTLDELLSLVDGKLYAECKGCTKDRNECPLRDFYENQFIPPVVDWGKVQEDKMPCNCEYAY